MKRNWAMSHEEEEEIPLIEFYKRIKTRRVMSRGEISVEEEKNSSPILTKEDADEMMKMKKPLPVCQYAFKHFRRYKDGHESEEEEVVGDGQRNEHKWGYKFILNPNKLTHTRPKFPIKLYFQSILAQGLPDRRSKTVLGDVEFVHPLRS